MSEATTQSLSYLDQSESVKNRLARLKARNVILRVNKLDKVFQSGKNQVTALRNISFQTHRREFFLHYRPVRLWEIQLIPILAGLETLTGGEVLLDGMPINGPGRDAAWRSKVTPCFPG